MGNRLASENRLVDRAAVRPAVEALRNASSFPEAETALDALTGAIGLPILAWGGKYDATTTMRILDAVEPELFVAGHYFMRAFERYRAETEAAPSDLSRLTRREWDCLRLMAQGYREAEVANLAGVAPTTV